MTTPQPNDEWVFLRAEEFADDEEVDRIQQRSEQAPEEGALHVERIEVPPAAISREDRIIDGSAPLGDGRVRYFDDEEPAEGPRPGRAVPADGDEHEPDLEELLESQHYSFKPERG